MNTTDSDKLSAAKDKLMKLKDNIHHLNYTNPHESLISGDVDIAYLFSSQAYLALEARPELKVVFANEGIGFGIDSWFIPKGAQNSDNAHKFLNYITDAENGAKITEQIMYLSPNKAAREFLPDTIKNNPIFNIPSEKLHNSEFILDIGDTAEEYTKIWTEFKQ
ncbi:MAG: extracellular solute-binding protein [Clostridia bacterium]|nr:extracellular solute-binding protein [Clostridia bacterium]